VQSCFLQTRKTGSVRFNVPRPRSTNADRVCVWFLACRLALTKAVCGRLFKNAQIFSGLLKLNRGNASINGGCREFACLRG